MKEEQRIYNSFINGDKKSLEYLVEKYSNDLINFIKKYVQRTDIAEDIAQDVFVYLLVNKPKFDFKYELKTYLYTIARSRALNAIKKEKKYVTEESNIVTYDNNEFEQIETNLDFKIALNRLPINYKDVLYLVEIEKLKYNEVCMILNKTLPQVKITAYRARLKLKKELEKRYEK